MPSVVSTSSVPQLDGKVPVTKSKALGEDSSITASQQLSVSGLSHGGAILPSNDQCAVHLELLEVIVALKRKVEDWGTDNGFTPETAWRNYLTLATARFTIFVDSIRSKLVERNLIPPIDVLMVWHAFMLNPGVYSRFERQVHENKWGSNGLDWSCIQKAIDADSASFTLDESSAVTLQEVGIHVDLLHYLNSDESFPILQMLREKDIDNSETSTPSTLQLASAVDDLLQNNNIFHLNSPEVKFDLISAVQRQFRFASKMASFNWKRSPFFQGTLSSAVERYEAFFQMMANNPQQMLAPTLEVDLVWHTHQLSPSVYRAYSREVAGRFINHNDDINEQTASSSFGEATNVYEETFGSAYALCLCWFCEGSRHSGQPTESTIGLVKEALETEFARRRDMGLPNDMAFAKAHCSECGNHPATRCVRKGSAGDAACGGCNGECGEGGCGGCNGECSGRRKGFNIKSSRGAGCGSGCNGECGGCNGECGGCDNGF
ncbi:hypothetical protein BT63DRAFT_419675 [Microthyrium microscopicum]|uniref:Uncharacterized protein n=1 Tax=Microthyrium microscopicum TaxID=703497 RepID=A0A6A6USL6_9PEZI|nr:hypothetical protein BT63DRAFT_419675 [Microthyrium microscopicum]